MSEKDKGNLLIIIESCSKIQHFAAHLNDADVLYADERTFDAILMNFVIIGEAVLRLSESVLADNSHITWSRIIGLRNIVAHNYFGVDAEEVWQIINANIPALKADVSVIITKS
jgi:uncharacterized protein with HEPN domain